MVLFHPFFTLTLLTLVSMAVLSQQQPLLDSFEQESVYQVLDSINSAIPWRSTFPDDLCSSAPHGVVCEFSSESNGTGFQTAHIVELSFGYVSDFSSNPPCSSNATLNPLLFTSFKYLKKLFFYKCFNESQVSVPNDIGLPGFASSLEELVFVENPSFVGPLSALIRNYTSLRRLVLTGNGVYGEIPENIGALINLEEITLSGNKLAGELPRSLSRLKKLKVFDISQNQFKGYVSESLGNLSELFKLDLSSNGFSGRIPESLGHLKNLELLDLSFNHFGNFGIPLCLREMPKLKEVYLSGNLLGGKIPEIWENLGGVLRIGFSNMGLIGNIPSSMGVSLKNLSYLGLDSNRLEGSVPNEFALLEFLDEINLENNNLSGRVPFSTRVGEKLKLAGNRELCVDNELGFAKNTGSLGQLKLCKKPDIPNAVIVNRASLVIIDLYVLLMSMGFLFVFSAL